MKHQYVAVMHNGKREVRRGGPYASRKTAEGAAHTSRLPQGYAVTQVVPVLPTNALVRINQPVTPREGRKASEGEGGIIRSFLATRGLYLVSIGDDRLEVPVEAVDAVIGWSHAFPGGETRDVLIAINPVPLDLEAAIHSITYEDESLLARPDYDDLIYSLKTNADMAQQDAPLTAWEALEGKS